MQRAKPSQSGQHAGEYAKLLTATGIPSLSETFANTDLSFESIWRLRDSDKGRDFRSWFNEAVESETVSDIRDAYIEALSTEHWMQSAPARVVRFIATTAAGILNPVAGVSVAALDAAAGARLHPVKLFLDDLRGKAKKAKRLAHEIESGTA